MSNSKRKHGKEADEVKLPALPTASQFRAWKTSVYQSVLQASGREDDKVLSWIREVEKPGAKPEDFADKTKEFATLDRKVAASLTKLAQGELGRQITQRNDEALYKECRMARGRELLCIVFGTTQPAKTPRFCSA